MEDRDENSINLSIRKKKSFRSNSARNQCDHLPELKSTNQPADYLKSSAERQKERERERLLGREEGGEESQEVEVGEESLAE